MTVYQRINELASCGEIYTPGHIKKSEIGRRVARRWHELNPGVKLTTTKQAEDTGVFYVLTYPDTFSSEMDVVIKSVMNRKRKRIPMRGGRNG